MPEPKRPSRRARHPLVIAGNAIFTIILVVGARGGRGLFVRQAEARGGRARSRREKVVNIPRGLGLRDIADLLARENVIEAPWMFIGGVLVLKARDDLKYGEYNSPSSLSLRETIETIVEGKVVQHAFTIPEGLTSEQIVARLPRSISSPAISARSRKRRHAAAGTYNFPRGTTREQVIQRMQQAHAACCRRSGTGAAPTCRSRRRKRS